jgi:tetratricopeptide (TPR) repeat protein
METAAWCAYYLGEFGYALTLAEEGAALADNPGTKARCLVIAGRLLHADGQLEEAERRYSDARKLADESGLTTLAATWLAALRCDQGHARDALELLRLAPAASDDVDQPLITRHRELALARAHMMLGEVAQALAALDRLAADGGPVEIAQVGPDGANLRAAILVNLGEVEAADVINLKELDEARVGQLRPQLEASLIGLGESRLVAGGRRSAMRYSGEAARARVAPYPFRWQQRGRSRLLQARLELAAGRVEHALAEARDLMADSSRSGDAVRSVAARLLEAEALAMSGAGIDTQAIGEVLKRAGDVLGAEAWQITARLARLTGNAGWEALADRQLEHVIQGSGTHAMALRAFAQSRKEPPGSPS